MTAWRDTAESISLDMAKGAALAALKNPDGTGEKTYTAEDGGLIRCAASFDGESVLIMWSHGHTPVCRTSAVTLIAARMESRMGAVPSR